MQTSLKTASTRAAIDAGFKAFEAEHPNIHVRVVGSGPVPVFYFFAQKAFIEGVTLTGVKG